MKLNKEFIRQRISIFSGMDIDPAVDSQVVDILLRKFNIHLPQRATLDEALAATISDHEVISLISQYRSLSKVQ